MDMYADAYRIPLSLPTYCNNPTLIPHRQTSSRPAVIFPLNKINVNSFPVDTYSIAQKDWGTNQVPQVYGNPNYIPLNGADGVDCENLLNRIDLKQFVDWKNTQLVITTQDYCPKQLYPVLIYTLVNTQKKR